MLLSRSRPDPEHHALREHVDALKSSLWLQDRRMEDVHALAVLQPLLIGRPLLPITGSALDWLGLKTWGAFARDAMVEDTTAFVSCMLHQEHADRIASGRMVGDSAKVGSTPTLVVNGWWLRDLPSAAQLERLVDALLSGEISERTAPHHLREIVGELKSPQMVRPSG